LHRPSGGVREFNVVRVASTATDSAEPAELRALLGEPGRWWVSELRPAGEGFHVGAHRARVHVGAHRSWAFFGADGAGGKRIGSFPEKLLARRVGFRFGIRFESENEEGSVDSCFAEGDFEDSLSGAELDCGSDQRGSGKGAGVDGGGGGEAQ